MNQTAPLVLAFVITLLAGNIAGAQQSGPVLQPEAFRHYIDQFNKDDEELYAQHIPNERAWDFLKDNIPLFECPDSGLERTYYFRWWTYRKQIKQTPDGFVITGLVGLRSQPDDTIEVSPLLPPHTWDWFCLDNVLHHGRIVTIMWDKTGEKYGRGKGLRIFADGRQIAQANSLERLTAKLPRSGTSAGWHKYGGNPVLGGDLGTCFDVTLLRENGKYRMWFSWRPKKSIALVESPDGIHWTEPLIVIGPNGATDWEKDINRPAVVKRDGAYHTWYTGQAQGHSWIGYATSPDGREWKRTSDKPVLSPEQPWENVAVMCPHVLWDEEQQLYRMWYSAGQQYEPNAIGYATSPDGISWTKHKNNPVFAAERSNKWEQHKVTACQVIPAGEWHIMFYIGFPDENRAQIGLARSRDGITNWQRHPANPIVFPTEGAWDADACYKPFALFDSESNRWLLWYNGRKGGVEQIGLVTHPGYDLGFPPP